MVKNKLQKFAQGEEYPHVQQPTLEVIRQGYAMKGKWKKDFFVDLKCNLYGDDLSFTKEIYLDHYDDISFTVSGKKSKRTNPKLKYNENTYMYIDHIEKEFREKKKKK